MTFEECHAEETAFRREEEAAVRRGDHAAAAIAHARRTAALDRAQAILERGGNR